MKQTAREVIAAEPLQMFELVFPSDLNAHGTMFGGRLVALMDKCAGMCASRWCHRPVVTASIDAIQFKVPVKPGQMVEFTARIVYVGRSSCLAKVEVHAEEIRSGDRQFCCRGYFTMVSIDSGGRPVELPMIPVETDQDRAEWELAARIKSDLLARRGTAPT